MSDSHPASRSPPPVFSGRTLAIAAAIILVAGGYWYAVREGDDADDRLTAAVVRGDIENTVTALGNLQPLNYVDVGAQVSGQLKKIYVEIGDEVESGDLVAEIDAIVQSARVGSTRAQLAAQRAQLIDREAQVVLAEDKYQRQVQLKAEDATSEEAFQSAKAAFDSAKAQVGVLKAQIQQTESTLTGDTATLGYSKIYAPISGTVVSLDAKEGQTLNANQIAPIILRIADLSRMTVWTQVSEADITKLKVGMGAYFTTLGNPDRRWAGQLRQVLPKPELVNNVVLYTALFDVDNPDGELKTQMSAQVFFVVGSVRDVLTVPAAALHAWVPPESEAKSGDPEATPATAETNGASPMAAVGRPEAAAGGTRPSREQIEQMIREGRTPPGFGRRQQGGDRASSRPRVQAVTVVTAEGETEERRVMVGMTNRVVAEILEGLAEGETVVTGTRAAQAQQQAFPPRVPGGFGGGGRGF